LPLIILRSFKAFDTCSLMYFDPIKTHFDRNASNDFLYHGPKTVKRSSITENRSGLAVVEFRVRVVEIMPVRVVEMVPTVVVEMVPVLVVEIVPVFVVEIMPGFASAGTEIARTKTPPKTMD
jgi:hypothetical protein